MFGWYITKMRNYGLLAQRFRKAYNEIALQQKNRLQDEIAALQVSDEEKERLRAWGDVIYAREYLARVPNGATEAGS